MLLTLDKRILGLGLAALTLTTLWFFKRTAKNPTLLPTEQASDEQAKPVNKACVIFDLHGVLFTINKQQALSQLGFLDTLAYTLSGKKTSDLEEKFIKVLDLMQGQFKTYYCQQHKDKPGDLIPLHNGVPLPMVMRDWAQGSLTGQEVIDKALPFIDALNEQEFFSSAQEKKLVRKTLSMIFDPRTRVRLAQEIPSGLKLVKKCKKLGHKVLLLSNMDTEFVDLLKAKHPEIFELFDGVIVSASVGAMKPYPSIYQHLFATFQVDPKLCFMIDDQEENVAAAQKAGMIGIHCDHTDHFVEVRQVLRSHGVLPEKGKTT